MPHLTKRKLRVAAILSLLLVLVVAARQSQAQGSEHDRIIEAWQQTERAGAYSFESMLTERTHPAPRLTTAGQDVREQSMFVQGESDRRAGQLHLKLWDDPATVLRQESAFEVLIEGNQAFGRNANGAWQPIDDISATFAPAGDAAVFLSAAENVTWLGSDSRELPQPDGSFAALNFDRYHFTLNSAQYAQFMRDQIENEFRARGELPPGVQLSTSDYYQRMVGEGEVWLDTRGLPLRITMTMEFPQEASGERVFLEVQTDFTGFDARSDLSWNIFDQGILGGLSITLPAMPRVDWQQTLTHLGMIVGLIVIGYKMMFSRSRRAEATLATLLSAQLALAPLAELHNSHLIEQFWNAHGPAAASAAPLPDDAAFFGLDAEAEQPWDITRNPLAGIAASQTAQSQQPDRPSVPRNPDAITDDTAPDADEDGLSDAEETAWGTGLNDPDFDGDGMSDGAEVDRCPVRSTWADPENLDSPVCPDPYYADTDNDGLSDGAEALYLATFPREVDTDHDGITDNAEVQGFLVGGVRYYSNPRNPDTNGDGLIDSVECPDLMRPDANTLSPWTPTSTCPDTDGDGVPDIFDHDNDGDGVPDRSDFSPQTSFGMNDPFDRSAPLNLELDNLELDKSVFVDFQVRPEDTEQLNYALNVLDWPSEDDEGQIRRNFDTTFGSAHGGGDSAFNGDMRLTPMLEVRMPLGSTDIPRVTAAIDVNLSTAGQLVGYVEFEPVNDNTQVQLTVDNLKDGAGTLTLSSGSCGAPTTVYSSAVSDDFSHTFTANSLGDFANGNHVVQIASGGTTVCEPLPSLTKGARSLALLLQDPGDDVATVAFQQSGSNINVTPTFEDDGIYDMTLYDSSCTEQISPPIASWTDISNGSILAFSPANLVDVADGSHSLAVSQDGKTVACAPVGNIVNGSLPMMVDTDFYATHQVTIHEEENNLVAMIPLHMSVDSETGVKAAFTGRMKYQRGNVAFPLDHEVNLIWLVTMLTDRCLDSGCTAESSDIMQVVHSYRDEAWYLTGLAVQEDLGGMAALVYEDINNSGGEEDTSPEFEDNLWHLARGLNSQFLNGVDCAPLSGGICQPDGVRDLRVSDIKPRFDADSNGGASEDERWGIHEDALHVVEHTFADQDGIAEIPYTLIPNILNSHFGTGVVNITSTFGVSPTQLTPNILVAREDNYRTLDLDASDQVTLNPGGNQISIDLDPAAVEPFTVASLSWAPYRYVDGAWEPFPIEEYWDKIELLLTEAPDFQPVGTEGEFESAADIRITQLLYLDMYKGKANAVELGTLITFSLTDVTTDTNAELKQIAEDARITTAIVRKGALIKKFIEPVVRHLDAEYRLYKQATRKFSRKMQAHLDYTFRGSMGRSIKYAGAEVKDGFLTAYRPKNVSGFRAKLHTGAAVGLQAAVALAGFGAAFGVYSSSSSVGDIVTSGLLAMSLSLEVEGALRIVSKFHTFKVGNPGASFKAFTGTLKTTSNSAKVAGIVGLIISQTLAFGAFLVEMIAADIAAFSLQFNKAASYVVSGAIVAALLTLLATTGIGAIIVAIIGVIDALIFLICGLAPPKNAISEWVCKGISGLLAEAVAFFLYDQTDIVTFNDSNRMQITGFDVQPSDLALGFTTGASLSLSLSVRNTIETESPDSPASLVYSLQFNDSNTRSTSLRYAIVSAKETDESLELHADLDLDAHPSAWLTPAGKYVATFPVDSTAVVLPEPGINQPVHAFLAEGYAVPVQECVVIPPIFPVVIPVPVCTVRSRTDTNYIDLGLVFDVFPASLEEFYDLTPKDDGYALSWAQSGDVTFPRLFDADGDGLNYLVDPNDSMADSDGDGLTDLREAALNTSPTAIDTDMDGLTDMEEVRLGTNPLQADSDSDGLQDADEVAGWSVTYSHDGSTTVVQSDPLQADADEDDIYDGRERAFGFNPWVYDQPTLLEYDLDLIELAAPILLLPLNERDAPELYKDTSAENSPYAARCEAPRCPIGGVQGRLGNAAAFDGVDDMLAVSGVPALNNLSNNFTVAAYIYPDKVTGLQRIVATSRELGDNGFGFGLVNDELRLTFLQIWDFDSTGLNIPANEWSHVMATVEDTGSQTEVTFYVVDEFGVPREEVVAGPAVDALPPGDDDLLIGGLTDYFGPTNVEPFDGRIDEVVVFNYPHHEFNDLALGYYNPDDDILNEGNSVAVSSEVRNKLLGRTLNGLLNTELPDVFTLNSLPPQNFVLPPGGRHDFSTSLTVENNPTSGSYAISQVAGAIADIPPKPTQFSHATSVYEQPQPLQFSGKAHYQGGGVLQNFTMNSGDFTIAGWINPTNNNQRYGIMGWNSGKNDAFPTLQLDTNGDLVFGYGTGDDYEERTATTSNIPLNTWTHIAVSFDRVGASGNAIASVYKNGILIENLNFGSDRPDSSRTTFEIGRSSHQFTVDFNDFDLTCEGDGLGDGEYDITYYRSDTELHYNLWSGVGSDGDDWETIFNSPSPPSPIPFSNWGFVTICEDDDGDHARCAGGDDIMASIPFDHAMPSDTVNMQITNRPNHPECTIYWAQYSDTADIEYAIANNSVPFVGGVKDLQIHNVLKDSNGVLDLFQQDLIIARFRLDERPGMTTFTDDVAASEGSCSGSTCPVTGVRGRENVAAYFDGSNDYFIANRVSELASANANGALSFGAWIKPDERTSGSDMVLGFHTSGGANLNQIWIQYQSDGSFRPYYFDDQIQAIYAPLPYSPESWHHVMAVIEENGTGILYVDGVEVVNIPPTTLVPAVNGRFTVGMDWDGGTPTDHYAGVIDDVYIAKRALIQDGTTNEVFDLANSVPVAQWTFDRTLVAERTISFTNVEILLENESIPVIDPTAEFELYINGAPIWYGEGIANDNFDPNIDNLILLPDGPTYLEVWEKDLGNLFNPHDYLGFLKIPISQSPGSYSHIFNEHDGSEIVQSVELDYTISQGSPPSFDEFLEGQVFESFGFNGEFDLTTIIGTTAGFNLSSGDFTLAAWILPKNIAGTNNYRPIVGSGNGFFFGLRDGKPYANLQGTIIEAPNEVPPEMWTHLMFQRESGTIRISVNGSEVVSAPGNEGGNSWVYMGAGFVHPGFFPYAFDGRLDEVAFYRRALNYEERIKLFNFQNTWVDESRRSQFVVDNTVPTGWLNITNTVPISFDGFTVEAIYMDGAGKALTAATNDEHSQVSTVFLAPISLAAGAPDYPAFSAFPCEDAEPGKMFCAVYEPDGEGMYIMATIVADQAGNSEVYVGPNGTVAPYLVIDDTEPDAYAFGLPPSPFRPSRIGQAEWAVPFTGFVDDPAIAVNPITVLGSGIKRLALTVYDANGLPVGTPGEQEATINGTSWSLDYVIDADRATGDFTAWLVAEDNVGNTKNVLLPAFSLDSIESEADISDIAGTGRSLENDFINGDSILSGSATEHPLTAESQTVVAGIDTVEVILEPMFPQGSPFVNNDLASTAEVIFPLDENNTEAGDLNDSFTDIANGLEATCSAPTCPLAAVGTRNGQGVHFDGVDDVLFADHVPGLATMDNDFIVSAWIKPTAFPSEFDSSAIVSTVGPDTSQDGFLFGLIDDTLHFAVITPDPSIPGSPDFNFISTASVLRLNVWQHVAVHMTPANNFEFYVNGVLVETKPYGSPILPDLSDRLGIGASAHWVGSSSIAHFTGAIDEVMITRANNGAVTVREMMGEGPMVHFPFDDPFISPDSALSELGGLGLGIDLISDGADINIPGKVGAYGMQMESGGAYLFNFGGVYGTTPFQNNPFTVAMWLKDASEMEFLASDNPPDAFRFEIVGSSLILGYSLGATDHTIPLASTAGWHHYAFVWDGSQVLVYQDGIFLDADTPASPAFGVTGDGGVIIGPTGSSAFGIDDLRIYQRALPSLEVAALANSGWEQADTGSRGPATETTTWNVSPPDGLEGFYAARARGMDTAGNFDPEPAAAWNGMVDTLAPRFDLSSLDNGSTYTYTFTVTDFNLDLASLASPAACDGNETTVVTNYRSSWHQALENQNSDAPDDRPYELQYTCQLGAPLADSDLFSICDSMDNCISVAADGSPLETMPLSISVEAAPAARLTWDSTIGCTYDVYESTTPYVFPGSPTYAGATSPYDVSNRLGDVNNNYVFQVRETCGGTPSAVSTEVGEFDFGITPGD